MSVAIGIDLGTTNTVVAAVVDGVAVTLQDDKDKRLIPSVVSFQPNGQVLVGEPAREKRLTDPESTIFSVKPLFGRSWDSDEAQAARTRFPFKMVQGSKSSIMVEARGTQYALPEISAFVLRRAKAVAEAALKQSVDQAVITVPANFNDLQRASTKIAGKLAGLEVMRILNEPTAAALAYGQSIKSAEKIAIYDLGGGTFDITLLDLTNSVFEVLATAGDTALGGDDIDRIVADKIIKDVQSKLKVDPRGHAASIARIGFLAEEIKKELSTADAFERELTGVAYKSNGKASLSIPFRMTRQELEQLAKPLFDRTISVSQQSMASVGLAPKDFERVILVGGATRMPLVARVAEAIFQKPASLKVNPDEVVALGAAIQAHALNRSKAAHKQVVKAAKPRWTPTNASTAVTTPAMAAVRPPTGPQPARPITGPMPARSGRAVTGPQPAQPPPVPKKPPVPRPAAPKVEEEHPALNETMTFSKGSAIVSWDLPTDSATVPQAPPPAQKTTSQATAIDELDLPELDIPPPSSQKPASSQKPGTGIVAAPEGDDLEAGLDLPVGATGTLMMAAPKVAPPPGFGGGTAIMQAPQVQPPPGFGVSDLIGGPREELGPPGEVFGEVDLGSAFTAERFQQGSAIQTSQATPLLIDVTPLSLGVETVGGYADVLIPANSPVPCEKMRIFMTASDNQTSVTVRVAQGESPKFAQNTRLGDVELSGLRGARRGEVKISVTFELDADGILNVRARDPDTGRETVATMRLVGTSNELEDMQAMSARQARHHVQ
jgi:molecular chaperone DnaK